MKITDPVMQRKMERALALSGNLYSLDDIEAGLINGSLQGHAERDTWAITQIQQFPQKTAVSILYIVGTLENSLKLANKIEEWAKTEVQAKILLGFGREGWQSQRDEMPGWRRTGITFVKEI